MRRSFIVRAGFVAACLGLGFGAVRSVEITASVEPPAILLAQEIDSATDPAAYLVSEKYDGARAYWDGRRLRFRSGRLVPAPAWFIERLPTMPLDGELWLGRGRFETLAAIVRRDVPRDDEWRQLHYMIFELPEAPGSFEVRAARIREIVAKVNWPQLVAVEQVRIADRAALDRRLAEVVQAGGEGLALHRADALYVTGRSDVLLKMKPRQDTEAVVVGHLPGKGKYAGMTGALAMETPEGRRFSIGSGLTDALRAAPPPVGTTITYTYRGLTAKGLPRFPTYLRVRQTF